MHLGGRLFEETEFFYTHLLNIPVRHRWNEGSRDRGVMFELGSVVLEIIDNGRTRGKVRGCAISLKVSNVRSLFSSLHKKVKCISKVTAASWGDTGFTIADAMA